jgi:hypothetical protein
MPTHDAEQAQPVRSSGRAARALTEWLVGRACEGVPPFESAYALAERYPHGAGQLYPDAAAAADALIRHEMRMAFTTGFVSGLAGILALPVALPAGVIASLLQQARMAASIAILYGQDPTHMGVRTTILLCLEAGYAPEAMRHVGSRMGRWAAARTVQRLSPAALLQINERVGMGLLRRAAPRPLALLGRALPVAGAVVAGGIDAYGARRVAREALSLFAPDDIAVR